MSPTDVFCGVKSRIQTVLDEINNTKISEITSLKEYLRWVSESVSDAINSVNTVARRASVEVLQQDIERFAVELNTQIHEEANFWFGSNNIKRLLCDHLGIEVKDEVR